MDDFDASDDKSRDGPVDVPTVHLSDIDATAQIIQRLQSIVLKHPIAANAAFASLVREGLAFAQTPEGRQWKDKLVRSELLHRARLALDLPGLSMLQSSPDHTLPSSYVDAIFMLASTRRADELLELLFQWGHDDDAS